MKLLVTISALSFLSSTFFVWIIRTCAYKYNWVVSPRSDRWNTRSVALYGGGGIFCAFALALGLFFLIGIRNQIAVPPILLFFLLGAGCMFLGGLYDDIFRIKPFTKLIIQFIAISIPITAGFLFSITPWTLVNILITFFWFVVIINAVNLIDNMDGLAAGVVIICLLTVLLLSWLGGGATVSQTSFVLTLVLVCALLGFLLFNRYPATIFMGDSGSLFLGYMLAGISIPSALNTSFGASSIFFALLVPVAILSLPLLDTLLVTVTRIMRGISPTVGGKDHSSHRLVGLGFSEQQAVLVLYILTALGGAVAIFHHFFKDSSFIALFLYVLFLLLVGIYLGRVRVHQGNTSQEASWTPLKVTLFYKWNILQIICDVMLIVFSYFTAYHIRFESGTEIFTPQLYQSLPIVLASGLFGLFIMGTYQEIWRLVTLRDMYRMALGVFIGSGSAVFIIALLYRFDGYSRSVFFMYALILFCLLAASRISFRVFDLVIARKRKILNQKSVIIYGAGHAGRMLLDETYRNGEYGQYRVVAFLDDDEEKKNYSLGGIKIFLPKDFFLIGQNKKIDEYWVSSKKIGDAQIKKCVESASNQQIAVKRFFVRVENWQEPT